MDEVQERAIIDKLKMRAREGAAFLDRTFGAGWEQKIDLQALDIASFENCVCGQILGRPDEKAREKLWELLRMIDDGKTAQDLGFYHPSFLSYREYPLLNAAWLEVIAERRNAQNTVDVEFCASIT